MSPSLFALPVLCALCLAQVEEPGNPPPASPAAAPQPQQKGRVLEATKAGVMIAVKAGQEPKVGTKVEVFIELPDLDGIAILAVGKVVEVGDGVVTATLESRTGRIEKNHLVRFTKVTGGPIEDPMPVAPVGDQPKPDGSPDKGPRKTNIPGPMGQPPLPDMPPESTGPDAPGPGAGGPGAGGNGPGGKGPGAKGSGGNGLGGNGPGANGPNGNGPGPGGKGPNGPGGTGPNGPGLGGKGFDGRGPENGGKPGPLPVTPGDSPLDFSQAVANYQRALMIVGDPQAGSGTGFVISREKRLVATNAHVADIAKIAVLNESRTSYKVIRRWYHPSLMRIMDDGRTRVQSSDSRDGEVLTTSADIAILQLEPSGPDLPAQVVLASPQEAQNIVGVTVGMLGYPGYQRDQQIKGDLYASSTFIQGTISRLTGMNMAPEAPLSQRQRVHFDAHSYVGFSGSPVFQRNGHVIVINNSILAHDGRTKGSDVAYGIRVDALWELIDKEGMSDFVSGDMSGFIKPKSFDMPVDPQVLKIRAATKLMQHSAELMTHDEYEEAREHINEAIALYPTYWRLHWQASKNINHYVTEEWAELSRDQKIPLIRESLKFMQAAVKYYEASFDKGNIRLIFDLTREMISIARLTNDMDMYKKALELLLSRQQSAGEDLDYFLALRGSIKTDINDLPGALEDLNEAIRMSPGSKDFYRSRAYVWAKLGQPAKASQDRARFEQILESEHAPDHKDAHKHGHEHGGKGGKADHDDDDHGTGPGKGQGKGPGQGRGQPQ